MRRSRWSLTKRLTFAAAAIIYAGMLYYAISTLTLAQAHATQSTAPCYTDTECMERFGGDGGPGQ